MKEKAKSNYFFLKLVKFPHYFSETHGGVSVRLAPLDIPLENILTVWFEIYLQKNIKKLCI